MEIRDARYSEILRDPNAQALVREYSNECSLPELGEARPQAHIYEALERGGSMQSYGLYEGEHLIGFAVLLFYPLPHYGKLIAATESIFIAAEHRGNGNGEQLLKFIESVARERGCAAVQYSVPVGSRFGRLLDLRAMQSRLHELRPGKAAPAPRYRMTNRVYMRELA